MIGSWKKARPRQLRKIAYALNESTLSKVVEDHEKRGWMKASEIKEHGYGVGILMVFNIPERNEFSDVQENKAIRIKNF